MIETLHFPATKCNIHVVVCRFFECAWGAFKGGARWYVKLRLAAFARGMAQKYGIQLSDIRKSDIFSVSNRLHGYAQPNQYLSKYLNW